MRGDSGSTGRRGRGGREASRGRQSTTLRTVEGWREEFDDQTGAQRQFWFYQYADEVDEGSERLSDLHPSFCPFIDSFGR